MLNVYGVGTLTADPEVRQVGDNNTSVCTANLAFNRRVKSGEDWKDEVCFVQVKLWGAQADRFVERCKKGTQVSVQGYMTQESWTGKTDGVKHNVLVMRLSSFNVCERNTTSNSANTNKGEGKTQATSAAPPKNNKSAATKPQAAKPQARKPEPVEEEVPVGSDEDIPF